MSVVGIVVFLCGSLAAVAPAPPRRRYRAGAILIMAGFGFFLTAATPAEADERVRYEPGRMVVVGAYCLGEEAAKLLSDRAAATGDAGYSAVMFDRRISCFDARIMRGVRPVLGRLVRRGWTMTHRDGPVFEFWLLADRTGATAWAWFRLAAGRPEVAI